MKLRQMLRRDFGKRNISDIAFQETNQEFESQRFQPHQASRWSDQAQRDKISLYGELELRRRLFQKKDCEEIGELRSVCCEEAARARQARIDEPICATREESHKRESIDGSDSGMTEHCEFFVRCKRIFTIPNQGAAHERPTSLDFLLFCPRTALRSWIAA